MTVQEETDGHRRETLQGAFDLHVHSYPDLMDRSVNDLDLARQAREIGMAGFVLKSHYAPTAERAWVVQAAVGGGLRVVGAVVLNHFVGGLNPLAVEALARAGGRLVFMPTSDAANESHLLREWDHQAHPLPPYLQIKQELAERDRLPGPICLVDSDGRLTSETVAVLEVVRDYDLVLATGHIGWQEMRALVPAAREMGVSRVVVTHPDSPSIDLDLEQQRHLVDLGAYIERCFAYLRTPEKMERALHAIKYTGPQRNVLSSDLGAVGYPHPHAGLADFIACADAAGFSSTDISRMVRDNPADLLR